MRKSYRFSSVPKKVGNFFGIAGKVTDFFRYRKNLVTLSVLPEKLPIFLVPKKVGNFFGISGKVTNFFRYRKMLITFPVLLGKLPIFFGTEKSW